MAPWHAVRAIRASSLSLARTITSSADRHRGEFRHTITGNWPGDAAAFVTHCATEWHGRRSPGCGLFGARGGAGRRGAARAMSAEFPNVGPPALPRRFCKNAGEDRVMCLSRLRLPRSRMDRAHRARGRAGRAAP
jgi:hypothetical protein